MSTDASSRIVSEADRIREEMVSLMADLKGRRLSQAPTIQKRVMELRERVKALGAIAEGLLLDDMATWLAVKQRLGREPADGEPVTAADETRAQEILASFGLGR